MDSLQAVFINNITSAYATDAYTETVRSNISVTRNNLYRYRFIYKRMLLTIITHYFSVFSLTDNNFCTEEEIMDLIDVYNILCDLDLEVDPEIDDLTGVVDLYWDDTRIWDDTDIWTETL